MPVLWDHFQTDTKPLHAHLARSACQWTSCSSGASGAPLLLSGAHMHAQNFCRTLSFSHIATCQIHSARGHEALREMGFELGGEAGARLGKKLSYPGSPDTILRLVKQDQLPTTPSPRVVGIDDWSWKRGLRYGTLICNLEDNRPIDVLPDRSVQTISAWFEEHPSVEIVSRDRSSEYAAAISKGAPQALQVADV